MKFSEGLLERNFWGYDCQLSLISAKGKAKNAAEGYFALAL